jgi:hypothetical protein
LITALREGGYFLLQAQTAANREFVYTLSILQSTDFFFWQVS